MQDTVAVPLWLAVAGALLAAWAFYEHVLMPALRWMVMHPANQVIDEVGKRLRIGIRPFQRTRRQALIHRLHHRPQGAAGRRAVRQAEQGAGAHRDADRRALRARDGAGVQRLPLLPHRLLVRQARGAAAVPRAPGLRGLGEPGARRARLHGGVRDEPPLQHGLRARRLPRGRPDGAVLRGGRMGAHLAAVGADPLDGRLLRAPQFQERALPPRARALHRDGHRGGRAAGGVPGGRADARRAHARAQAGRHRLHDARLSHGRRARPGVRAARASTTTACWRTGRCCARSTRRRRGAGTSARSAPRSASPATTCG